jgi:ATP-dependent Clp protease ATP-binding subunit ClpA
MTNDKPKMSVELNPLFSKLNAICHKAFELAAELCVAQSHYSIEIEHVLLKLLEQSDTDVQVILHRYEVSVPKLKRDLNRAIEKCRRGNERTLYLSPSILALLREAWLISSLQLDTRLIRSGAMLLAIIDNESLRGGVVKMLPSLMKISRESLRQDLRGLLKRSSEADVRAPNAETPLDEADSTTTTASPKRLIDQYTIDLTEKAHAGRLDPIVGRDTEIRQIIDILTRRHQNNPILIGDTGVGKTTLVKGFALKIANGEVPKFLQNVSLRLLDSEQLPREDNDEFKTLIKSMIKEIKASAQPIIWFIDEIQTLMEGRKEAAHTLKPLLARGEIRTLVTTTWAGYQKYIEKEPTLHQRFQVVKINEPSESLAISMLRCRVANLEKYHKVRITDKAVRQAVQLSRRYISGRQLPEKAISVLDTACAKVSIVQNSTPPVLETTLQQIARLQEELRLLQREHKTGHNHTLRLEKLTRELKYLENFKTELEERYTTERGLVKKLRKLEYALEQILPAPVIPSSPPLASHKGEQEISSGPSLPSDKGEKETLASHKEGEEIPLQKEGEIPLPKTRAPKAKEGNSASLAKDRMSAILPKDRMATTLPKEGESASLPQNNDNTPRQPDDEKASLPKEGQTKPLFLEQADDSSDSVSTNIPQSPSKREIGKLTQAFLRKNKNIDSGEPQKANSSFSLLPFKIQPSREKTEKGKSVVFLYENGEADDAISPFDKAIPLFEKGEPGEISQEEASSSPIENGEQGELLQAELKQVKQKLAKVQANDPLIPTHVDEHVIATVISTWTGIAIDNLVTDETNTFLNLKKKMAECILGQPQALETVVRRIQTQRADLDNPNKHKGGFLLVGPSGVGKTETAITLADILYGGERFLITLNMSDYQEAYSVSSLTGAPPGAVGYGKGGALIDFVRHHPYCVILLEQIEKAHPTLIKFLTQVFDRGILENDTGLRVDFKNTLILLTSHIGNEVITRLCNTPGFSPSLEKLQDALRPVLLQHFQLDFLSQLVVVPYHPLGDLDIRRIIKLKLTKLQQRFREKHHAQLTYGDSLLDTIANRCTEVDSGAHNINPILADTLLPSLSANILGYTAKGQTFSTVHLSCDEIGNLHAQFDTSLESPLEEETETAEKAPKRYNSNELIDDLDEVLECLN